MEHFEFNGCLPLSIRAVGGRLLKWSFEGMELIGVILCVSGHWVDDYGLKCFEIKGVKDFF